MYMGMANGGIISPIGYSLLCFAVLHCAELCEHSVYVQECSRTGGALWLMWAFVFFMPIVP